MASRIQAVERAADIMTCFSPQHAELGVSEISRMIQLETATVCRILLTLESRGFVYRNPISHRYRVGPCILQLAQIALGDTDLRHKALPHMLQLRHQTGETVGLSVLIGNKRSNVELVDGTHDLRHTIRLGTTEPLYGGASSKLLLAFMPETEIDRYLATTKLVPYNEATTVDPTALKAELIRIRSQGFAISVGEMDSWTVGVAAPIRDYLGKVVASLFITLPAARYRQDTSSRLIAATKQTADQVSAEMGYSPTGALATADRSASDG